MSGKTPERSVSPICAEQDGSLYVRSRSSNLIHQESLRFQAVKELLADIDTESDADLREEKLAALAEAIPVLDISYLLDKMQSYGPEADFGLRLLHRWAASDPMLAAEWIKQVPEGDFRDSALLGVATEWAKVDSSAAVCWAKALSDTLERNSAVLAIANETIRVEPVEALRLAVENLPDDPQRNELIRRAAAEWSSRDAMAAFAWADKIPDVVLRGEVLESEIISWAEFDPVAAANAAVEKIVFGRLQEDTVIAVIQRWAQQQPAAALAWVDEFPDGQLRSTAMNGIREQCGTYGRIHSR